MMISVELFKFIMLQGNQLVCLTYLDISGCNFQVLLSLNEE